MGKQYSMSTFEKRKRIIESANVCNKIAREKNDTIHTRRIDRWNKTLASLHFKHPKNKEYDPEKYKTKLLQYKELDLEYVPDLADHLDQLLLAYKA